MYLCGSGSHRATIARVRKKANFILRKEWNRNLGPSLFPVCRFESFPIRTRRKEGSLRLPELCFDRHTRQQTRHNTELCYRIPLLHPVDEMNALGVTTDQPREGTPLILDFNDLVFLAIRRLPWKMVHEGLEENHRILLRDGLDCLVPVAREDLSKAEFNLRIRLVF